MLQISRGEDIKRKMKRGRCEEAILSYYLDGKIIILAEKVCITIKTETIELLSVKLYGSVIIFILIVMS